MVRNWVSERLEYLWQRLVAKTPESLVDQDNEVSDVVLSEYNIRRVSCDFEDLGNALFNKMQNPPILFEAMSEEEMSSYPIAESAQPTVNDYDSEALEERRKQMDRVFSRAYQIFLYMRSSMSQLGIRENLHMHDGLLGLRQLDPIGFPNPFLLGSGLYGAYPTLYDRWRLGLMLEPDMVDGHRMYPHVTLGIAQSHNGQESSMLFGELAPLISAMRNRAIQPQVTDDEDEQEALFIENSESIMQMPGEFKDEQRFPVLLLSLLGPQHGRMFYACMDDNELVIRQSRLYSFERMETAPFDLFVRVAMCRPLSTAQLVENLYL
ncbi:hypothetical protein BO78DRAFT_415675 [Aspergillus sclerotiicarbonarius CBS 121057]|uniref:Uncharacterized protein n=1 Tax=Aspergillus sclerotiicarbonarius (strain CBS 121057 / IBT 28362) TaxID=1448318 RepID=A0A319ER53_ASPSB|nr:hypothetical protein BO78DRAFT_415675 [Aspergillus sclerotiicarbonarius CBS 121057]